MVHRLLILVLVLASMPGCAYWLHPSLNLYAKVVDQNGQPVPEVRVIYQVTRGSLIMGPMQGPGSHEYTLTTDRGGEFEVGTRAVSIWIVAMEKTGYVLKKGGSQKCYERYHVPENAKCSERMSDDTPIIIPAWKRGAPAELIASGRGTSVLTGADEHVKRFQLEGVPIEMELQWSRTGTWTDPQAWSMTLRVIDGGIMENTDAFPYEAPASGYQAQWTENRVRGTPEWTPSFRKRFYLTAANGKYYGHALINFDPFFRERTNLGMSYSINPNGSRNLLNNTASGD